MTTTLGGLVLVTPPAEEPVTLAEAKLHLRVDIPDDDLLIEALLVAAREYVEMYTRRQLVTATWQLQLDTWLPCIRPPKPPLQGVTEIEYLDTSETLQAVDPTTYRVDTAREPGRIVLATGVSWPSLAPVPGAVQVTYDAGYGAASAVPETFKSAIKLLCADLYEHRESQSEIHIYENMTVCRLLWGVTVLEVG